MRSNYLKRQLFLTAVGGVLSISAMAEDDFSVYGFINLGVSYLDHDYVTIESYEAGDPTFFKHDTMLGLQVSKPLTERTSATVQGVARGDNDLKIETSLAFVSHALNESTDLRFGRLRIPFFYYSEFIDVGYAYNWVRPSADVYAIPFDDFDGIDLTHRFSFADIDAQVQLNSGRREKKLDVFGEDYEANLKQINGVSLTLFNGDFTHRIGAQQTEMNLDSKVDPLLAQAIATGTPINTALTDAKQKRDTRRIDAAQTLAQLVVGKQLGITPDVLKDFTLTEQDAHFYNLATTYDNGDFSVVMEAIYLDYDSGLLVDNFAWMGGVAQRFDDLTVHATYSSSRDRVESGEKGKLQKALKLQGEDDSVTLGVRYDLDAATALKFEMTHHDEETNRGAPGRSANLYRLALQLVF